MLDAFAKFKGGPLCHTFGNHEVSAIQRKQLLPMMQIPPTPRAAPSAPAPAQPQTSPTPTPTARSHHPPDEAGAAYYDMLLDGGVRLVALDTYDAAVAGYPDHHPKRARAEEMLAAGKAKGESPYLDHPELNGGVDTQQLAWLESVLQTSKENKEVVIVFSHAPVLPEVTMDGYVRPCCANGRGHTGAAGTSAGAVQRVRVLNLSWKMPGPHVLSLGDSNTASIEHHCALPLRLLRTPLCSNGVC